MLTEDDLVAYIQGMWTSSPPGSITKDTRGNLSNRLIVKRKSSPAQWIAANVQQIDNVFELRLSHVDKDAIDVLSSYLMTITGNVPSLEIEYQDKDALGNHVWRIRFSAITLE